MAEIVFLSLLAWSLLILWLIASRMDVVRAAIRATVEHTQHRRGLDCISIYQNFTNFLLNSICVDFQRKCIYYRRDRGSRLMPGAGGAVSYRWAQWIRVHNKPQLSSETVRNSVISGLQNLLTNVMREEPGVRVWLDSFRAGLMTRYYKTSDEEPTFYLTSYCIVLLMMCDSIA